MAKKRATKKPSGVNDNINDFLDRREVSKYGPRIVGNEAQYMDGDMSKALRAKMAADRFLRGRTTEAGTKSTLDGMKNFMRSGARGAFRGGIRGGGGGRPGTRL
jgi:hypothetical protein